MGLCCCSTARGAPAWPREISSSAAAERRGKGLKTKLNVCRLPRHSTMYAAQGEGWGSLADGVARRREGSYSRAGAPAHARSVIEALRRSGRVCLCLGFLKTGNSFCLPSLQFPTVGGWCQHGFHVERNYGCTGTLLSKKRNSRHPNAPQL